MEEPTSQSSPPDMTQIWQKIAAELALQRDLLLEVAHCLNEHRVQSNCTQAQDAKLKALAAIDKAARPSHDHLQRPIP